MNGLLTIGLLLAQGVSLPQGSSEAQARAVQDSSPWILNHGGVQARVEEDYVLEIIRHPVLSRGEIKFEAAMAIFWLDRKELMSRQVLAGAPLDLGQPQDLLDELSTDPASAVLREVYFEGPIEYFEGGKKVGSASAFYLDLLAEQGWIADAELLLPRTVRDRKVLWRARSKWLERRSDGALHSNQAVFTTCSFVDQHLFVQTDNLNVTRSDPGDESSYAVELSGNALRAYGIAKLPLPPISWRADQEGNPILPEIRIGSSARFGTFVETALSFDASDAGDVVHDLLGPSEDANGEPIPRRSDASIGLSWLGSRGVLLDIGIDLGVQDRYRWQTAIGGLVDGARDRGLLRVEEDDRSALRTWLRSRGRFQLDDHSWLDLVVSTESDPGVQAEFYQDQFLFYEERENYLNWRRADGSDYLSARVKVQVDSARTQVEEYPSLRAMYDRRPIASLGSRSLLYSSDSTAAWLRRNPGSSKYQSPFADPLPFSDGLGDRHVLRIDSAHLFELPVALAPGWKLTPFVEARGTAWDRDTTEDDEPLRFDLVAGSRLATSFWRRSAGGVTAQLTPFVELRENLVHEQDGGSAAVFDDVDLDTGADSLEVGLRARLFGWGADEELDIELSTLDLSHDDPSSPGWQTLDVFAGLKTHVGSMPLGLSHDGRYGRDDEGAILTRSTIGLRPTESFGLELSHARGLDETGEVHYEAAEIQALYTWTPKWEFEGRQTLSVLEDASLGYEAILRRYGHDLVFEIGAGRVSGEGGTTISLKVRPELLFRRPRVGFAQHR